MGKNYKLSIATAYFNRKKLFMKTLDSINLSKYAEDIEVIVVDDGSDEEHRLEDIVENYKFPINLIRLEKKKKWYINPCIPFNKAFKEAKADLVLIQNPECFHYGDVVKTSIENTTDDNYLSFSCYALDDEDTNTLHEGKMFETINEASNEGYKKGWYNHSKINPRPYHFAACITKKNLEDLGGFDEKYAKGIGFDDDEFLYRVCKKGLTVHIGDSPFVIHQCHYKEDSFERKAAQNNSQLKKNYDLFHTYTQQQEGWRVNQ